MGAQYMDPLRSEEMSLCQLYCPIDVAHATVEELATMDRVQFKDLNPNVSAFQRTYTEQIKRCDEAERRLRFLTHQIRAQDITIRPFEETASLIAGRSGAQALDEFESSLGEYEARVAAMNNSYESLEKRALELEEARQVLRETDVFFREARSRGTDIARSSFDEPTAPLLGDVEQLAGHRQDPTDAFATGFELEFVAGTIDRARIGTFERVLWRVLRGNLYMNYTEIDDSVLPVPSTEAGSSAGGEEKKLRKNVFIIFAHGADLLDKIRKIADSMGATLFPIDSNADKREEKLREVTNRIEDLNSVLYNTNQTRVNELVKIAGSISAWWTVVKREKIVFSTLNLWQWDQGRKTLLAEGWIPTRDIPAVQSALRQAAENAGTSVPALLHELKTHATPPTFHRTNKFTEGFQSIIDAYGMATYQEVNPGLFTIITFPFLFAVMFGDIGHGFIMMLGALGMILMEKRLAKGTGSEMFDTPFYGRYIIFLMGLFAMFTGFIYNDIFSLSLTLGPSHWRWPRDISEGESVEAIVTGSYYPFGIDPGWHGADNALIFTNSLKMKMSIVIGVIHMTFAICLQVLNHRHFKKPQLILAEFLPQLLFMESIFGYLLICIVYKWAVDWEASGRNPPNLLNMLIKMFLSPGTVADEDRLFSGQAFVQVVLLLVALICVPWMLVTKPYLEYREHKKIAAQGYQGLNGVAHASSDEAEDESEAEAGHAVGGGSGSGGHGEEGEEGGFDMGEVVIHQIIHTIEFCLGCISNTASYLRLWALSLAHAQLSEVLWSMTIESAFDMEGATGIAFLVVMFAFWFVLTVSILILMEGLSAFLHALRLHWVEFCSKFLEAAGWPFEPLSFKGTDEIDDGP